MDPLQRNFPNGGFFTRNLTRDPRFPENSYYESMGWRGTGNHNTNIFDANGNLLSQTEREAVLRTARNFILDQWNKR